MKLKRTLVLLLALVMSIGLFAGCAKDNKPVDTSKPVETTMAPVEQTETPQTEPEKTDAPQTEPEETEAPDPKVKLGVKNAKNFSIKYYDKGVKVVTDATGQKLLLAPEGAELPAEVAEQEATYTKITTPIKRAIYTSTTHVSYMGELGVDSLFDTIAAVTTKKEEWTTPQVLERFEKGQIKHIDYGWDNPGDIESYKTINPDIVFTENGNPTSTKLQEMLKEVEIKWAAELDWQEANEVASLEWIKFFAAFFNKDVEAHEIYEAKLARLDELYKEFENTPDDKRPVVAYASVFNGVVYTQAGGSVLATQLRRAGAKYAMAAVEGEGNLELTMEAFLKDSKDADILIYASLPQYVADKAALLAIDPLFGEFKAFKENKVYFLDKGHYMNKAKVVEKFEDLVAICHPDKMPDHKFTMYQLMPEKAE